MLKNKLLIEDISDTCTACGSCINICPKQCLTMEYDEEGFLYPYVDRDKCITCHACELNCHVINPPKQTFEKASDIYYAGWHNDESIRENSSSGGAFTLFAEYILANGGIVFASRYNGERERLEFADTDHYPLSAFRKSRYIESNTLTVFNSVKEEVLKGRFVLFCGTPCQISGLVKFLRKKPENLLLMDFICHGVPSNYLFTLYKRQFERKDKITNVDFRYKNFKRNLGWHQLNLRLEFANQSEKIIPEKKCSNYRLFFTNTLLRKSCYKCSYLEKKLSDITIADFWGVLNVDNIIDDNKGISLLILHTEQIIEFFNKVRSNGIFYELQEDSIQYAFKNRAESYSLKARSEAAAKVKYYGYLPYLKKMYGRQILINNIKDFVKWILKR